MLVLTVVLLLLQASLDVDCSGAAKKSHYIAHKFGCSKFDPDLNSITEKQEFMLIQADGVSTLASTDSVYDKFRAQCSNQAAEEPNFKTFSKQVASVTWRFQYMESHSCIRVELDLGRNITAFKNVFNYNYYMFSYRELSHRNKFDKRHPIVNSVNVLTLNKVHARPYIVCVTFYSQKIPESTVNNITESNNMTCEDYSKFIRGDNRAHDVNLCVDIDTHSDFMSMPVKAKVNALTAHLNPKLIMSIFIIILLVIMLAMITIAHYIIEKRKNPKNVLQGLSSLIKSSPPKIMVTDFSSKSSCMNSEPREADYLLEQTNPSDRPIKVQFSLDELEENEPSKNDDEALNSVMHLLDDKPWLQASSSSQQLSSRGSRSGL